MIPKFRIEINYPEAKPEWKKALFDCLEIDLSNLIRSSPWLTMILANLEVVAITSKLASVSIRRIYLNCWPHSEGNQEKNCYYEYTKPQRYAILHHLLGHLIFKHTNYPKDLDPALVAISQDAVVNNVIEKIPSLDLTPFEGRIRTDPTGTTLIIGDYKIGIPYIDDLNWTDIYNILFDYGLDSSSWEPDVESDPNLLPEEIEKFNDKINSVLTQLKDKLPDPYKRELWNMLTPKVSLAEKIRLLINNIVNKTDYTYSPNPKKIHIAILPTLKKVEGGKIFVAFDSSASMSREEIEQAIAEIRLLKKRLDFNIEIIICDQEITKTYSFDDDSEIDWKTLEMPGQRGTSFVPVFEYIEEKKEDRPSTLIFCTDLYGTFPETKPKYPVIWLTKTTNTDPPFGNKILI